MSCFALDERAGVYRTKVLIGSLLVAVVVDVVFLTSRFGRVGGRFCAPGAVSPSFTEGSHMIRHIRYIVIFFGIIYHVFYRVCTSAGRARD